MAKLIAKKSYCLLKKSIEKIIFSAKRNYFFMTNKKVIFWSDLRGSARGSSERNHPADSYSWRTPPQQGTPLSLSYYLSSSSASKVLLVELPCASRCFPIFHVLIDWRSSYHVHKILSIWLLNRKTMVGPAP